MKKWILAAGLSLALLTGTSWAGAQNYELASGDSMPLGETITVHQGSTSYLSGEIDKVLSSPDLQKNMEQKFIEMKTFAPDDTVHPRQAAEEVISLLKRAQLSQLQSDADNSHYQEFAVSVLLTRQDMQQIAELARAYRSAHPEDMRQAEESSLGTLYDAMTSWINPEQKTKIEEILDRLPIDDTTRQKVDDFLGRTGTAPAIFDFFSSINGEWRHGINSHAVPYLMGTEQITPANDGTSWPITGTILWTTSRKGLCLTYFVGDQVNGAYFAPYVEKGVEELK